jgi:CheY-like chemotaxis protein
MNKRWRTLILDTDPDTLLMLQQVLEGANIDVTVTWNKMEACQLIETASFDLILIGDHPPELNAAAIFDNLSFQATRPPVLVLRGVFSEKDAEYFRQLGATAVVSKRDPQAVLEQVTKALAPIQFKAKAATAGLTEARGGRAAS